MMKLRMALVFTGTFSTSTFQCILRLDKEVAFTPFTSIPDACEAIQRHFFHGAFVVFQRRVREDALLAVLEAADRFDSFFMPSLFYDTQVLGEDDFEPRQSEDRIRKIGPCDYPKVNAAVPDPYAVIATRLLDHIAIGYRFRDLIRDRNRREIQLPPAIAARMSFL